MTVPTLEERIVALEAEVTLLKQSRPLGVSGQTTPWWQRIRGTFKDDPEYDEAMRLGREYRESLRPPDYEKS